MRRCATSLIVTMSGYPTSASFSEHDSELQPNVSARPLVVLRRPYANAQRAWPPFARSEPPYLQHVRSWSGGAARTLNGLSLRMHCKQGSVTEVPCVPLGKLLDDQGLRHVNFFSLDVEGAELSVLQVRVQTPGDARWMPAQQAVPCPASASSVLHVLDEGWYRLARLCTDNVQPCVHIRFCVCLISLWVGLWLWTCLNLTYISCEVVSKAIWD